jgi:beta-ribofuranosylaminobenzene 5'-phosphate synthase
LADEKRRSHLSQRKNENKSPNKAEKIKVSAPARIHMGILNPSRGVGERAYASAGVAVREPRTIVEVESDDKLSVTGSSAEESRAFARRILDRYKLKGAKINVLSTPPRHAGLGSTTQLSLSIAMSITKLHGLNVQPVELATLLGRGKQSAIGTYAFQEGGFIVEGGWAVKTVFPPLLFRYSFPEDWPFLIIVPESRSLDEKQEISVFEKLPAPQEKLVYEASYRLLLGMAPAILEKNVVAFGENLVKLQEVVGAMFSKAQGGVYQPDSAPLIKRLKEIGAVGVGQSSWGPAVYGLFDPKRSQAVEDLLKREIISKGSVKESDGNLYGSSDLGEVYFTRADNKGAVATRFST